MTQNLLLLLFLNFYFFNEFEKFKKVPLMVIVLNICHMFRRRQFGWTRGPTHTAALLSGSGSQSWLKASNKIKSATLL